MADVGVKRFRIVTHSYASLFSMKTSFRETNISSAKKIKKNKKKKQTMRDCASTSKIKKRSFWTFFLTLLMSAVAYILKIFNGN